LGIGLEGPGRRIIMTDRSIYLALRRSLDAAFRGEVFEGPDILGAWGVTFVTALKEGYPKYRTLRDALRDIACNILDKFALCYDPDELTEEVLLNPHVFLRTVILVARQRGVKTPGPSGLPPDLH
jgi:hypothetical protein